MGHVLPVVPMSFPPTAENLLCCIVCTVYSFKWLLKLLQVILQIVLVFGRTSAWETKFRLKKASNVRVCVVWLQSDVGAILFFVCAHTDLCKLPWHPLCVVPFTSSK